MKTRLFYTTLAVAAELASDSTITAAGKSGAGLINLKVGDRIGVSYTDEHGTLTAYRIETAGKGTPETT